MLNRQAAQIEIEKLKNRIVETIVRLTKNIPGYSCWRSDLYNLVKQQTDMTLVRESVLALAVQETTDQLVHDGFIQKRNQGKLSINFVLRQPLPLSEPNENETSL